MTPEAIQLLANYGMPAFLTLYVTVWVLNKGFPMVNNWVLRALDTIGSRYQALSDRDTTLDENLQTLSRELTIVRHQQEMLLAEFTAIKTRQQWQERKIFEILNGLGYTKKWDDPSPTESA